MRSAPAPRCGLLGVALVLSGVLAPEALAQDDDPADVADLQPRVVDLRLRVLDLQRRVESPEGLRAESPSQVEFAISADLLFAFNEATLAPEARAVLSGLADDIRRQAMGPIAIVGHTDAVGSDAFNLDLSRRRAAAVETELDILLAGSAVAFATEGRGENEPVAEETGADGADDPEARARNRRVTVTYTKQASQND